LIPYPVHHFLYFQNSRKPVAEIKAKHITIIKAPGCFANGIATFIENALTTNVGAIMAMVIIVRVFINMFRLLLTMETRASIRLARIFE